MGLDWPVREGIDRFLALHDSLEFLLYGAGEYFGTDAGTSLSYSQGGRCMLVFAVLLDASGITHHQEGGLTIAGPQAAAPRLKDGESGPGMVVVNRIENQLPLFSIRYTVKRGVPAARQPLAPPPRPNYGAGRARKAVRKAAAPKRKYAPAAPPAMSGHGGESDNQRTERAPLGATGIELEALAIRLQSPQDSCFLRAPACLCTMHPMTGYTPLERTEAFCRHLALQRRQRVGEAIRVQPAHHDRREVGHHRS